MYRECGQTCSSCCRAGVANAIVVVPQYLNVLEAPPAGKDHSPPTNGGSALRPTNGGAAGSAEALAGGRPEDIRTSSVPEGGSALVVPGRARGPARRLETWQLLTAHESGQCQLWDDDGEGMRPVAVIGAKCSPARRGYCASPPHISFPLVPGAGALAGDLAAADPAQGGGICSIVVFSAECFPARRPCTVATCCLGRILLVKGSSCVCLLGRFATYCVMSGLQCPFADRLNTMHTI